MKLQELIDNVPELKSQDIKVYEIDADRPKVLAIFVPQNTKYETIRKIEENVSEICKDTQVKTLIISGPPSMSVGKLSTGSIAKFLTPILLKRKHLCGCCDEPIPETTEMVVTCPSCGKKCERRKLTFDVWVEHIEKTPNDLGVLSDSYNVLDREFRKIESAILEEMNRSNIKKHKTGKHTFSIDENGNLNIITTGLPT